MHKQTTIFLYSDLIFAGNSEKSCWIAYQMTLILVAKYTPYFNVLTLPKTIGGCNYRMNWVVYVISWWANSIETWIQVCHQDFIYILLIGALNSNNWGQLSLHVLALYSSLQTYVMCSGKTYVLLILIYCHNVILPGEALWNK
jgi:hypothetical protein